jgi:hypothetical protein
VGRTAQLRPSRLRGRPLKEATEWLESYRGFWEESFDRFDRRLRSDRNEVTMAEEPPYCDALDAAHGDNAVTAEWLAWARAYTARLDPLTKPPAMPEPPDASPEALQDHLPDGWSAQGPHNNHDRRPHTAR